MRARTLWLCLFVAFAVSAVLASSAWAERPEFGRCEKAGTGLKGGGYSNDSCTKHPTGKEVPKYEWIPGAEKAGFTTTARVKLGPTARQCKSAITYEGDAVELGEEAEANENKQKKAEKEEDGYTPPEAPGYREDATKDRTKQKSYENKSLKKYEEAAKTKSECEKVLKEAAELEEAVVLETAFGEKNEHPKVECTGLSGTGRYSGTNTVADVETVFTGCELELKGATKHELEYLLGRELEAEYSCQSGSNAGEIQPATLRGELGVITNAAEAVNDTVGVVLWPESSSRPEPGATVATFDCGPIESTVTGSVIHEVVTNKMIKSETEKFIQKEGKQHIEMFEGMSPDILHAHLDSVEVQAGMGLLSKLTNEEKLEVNTFV
jgi:hypothetical protein